MRRWQKIGLGVLATLGVLVLWQWALVSYGWMQARGQLHIMLNTQPVAEVLADPAVPDSAKRQIKLIQEIKRFAVDSLGLNPSENYTTFYDQQGRPLLWVLVGAERYQLKAVEHVFPILGTFSYRGFFDKERLDDAQRAMKKQGYDTQINEVSAYSTLGFFRDPILSSMLRRSPGRLAELIIHELTHGTLFIKNSLDYNENLADFVGEYGALRWLKARYGLTSAEYRDYVASKDFGDRYDAHILRGTARLDSLYKTFRPATNAAEKERLKWQCIGQIVQAADTLRDDRPRRTIKRRPLDKTELPNNAYFVGYLTYRNQQNQFRTEFEGKFSGNFKRYLTYLKQTYPSL